MIMERKYETTPENGMLRIRAIRDFGNVKTGDRGGLIEKEDNLSHNGTCWVGGSARVGGYAQVYGSAQVDGSAQVYGSAWVGGYAQVDGSAQVGGSARVGDSAQVYGSAQVGGSARVGDSAQVYGSAQVGGSARVGDSAQVYGSARVGGSARVSRLDHVLTVGPCEHGTLTVFRTETDHLISVGCQEFTLDEIDTVASKSDSSPLLTAMLPGLKAMLTPLVASWHEVTA